MATLRVPLDATQGTEFARRFAAFSAVGPDGPEGIVDLTDFSMEFVVRQRQFTGASELLRASTSNGLIVNSGVFGYFDVQVPAELMGFDDGDFFYWLLVWPNADESLTECWCRGPFKMLPGADVIGGP